jgi:hypothetical protein
MKLQWIDGRFVVCRLDADASLPDWLDVRAGLVSVTRTDRELSIVAPESQVPRDIQAERGWIALRVVGILEFSMVGVLSKLTGALAQARVPVLAISTHDTDYLLVKEGLRDVAQLALAEVAGWEA